MPYTLSHVAVVAPVARLLARLRILSAVVIGSMVPDFGYLMPNHPPRFETHSALALVTFCLPVGLLSYWIFQRLLKTPLVSVLPDQAYMRWRPYSAPAAWSSPQQWLLAAGGVLAGAVTHLAWDGFTHEGARGVRMVPELADTMLELHGHVLTGTRLFQDLSSLLGLVTVVVAICYALRGSGHLPVAPRVLTALERRIWVFIYTAVTLGLCVAFLFLDPAHSAYRWLSSAAIALLRALVLTAVGVSPLMLGYLRAKR